ncbi:MAG TPA: hypothetical protein VF559_00490 [Caulobacteraceae bacterium]|jgi:hypothetical protein
MKGEVGRGREAEEEDRVRFLERELKKTARMQQHLREKFAVLHEALNRMNEAVQTAAPFPYPDELKPVVKLEGRRSDLVFLSFAGLNLGMGMPPFEFLRSFRERDVPGYFIKDFHQSWYQQGLLGISRDMEGTREYLAGLLAPHEGARLATLGASSGGYAAIVFGCWLGARRVAAFSPQTAITKRIVAQYAALDTPEATEFLHGSGGVLDLRTFLQAQESPPEITVYFGADHPQDTKEARRLEGLANVSLVAVEGVEGHSVTAALKRQGRLDDILEQLTGD